MPIDGLIAFAGSDMGAKYCDCPACAACEKILAHKDELIG